ncbi:MAG: hypothetical protein AAGF75_11935, partial [Cyanobacteria bacterium P01_H01_bin.130]
TESTPIEIEPKELQTPSRGRRQVNTHTTSSAYGDDGFALVTQEVYFPIRRVFGVVGQLAGTDFTRWYVEDAVGAVSRLLSTIPGHGGTQWGRPVRYVLGPIISGSEPVTSYALEVRDSAGNERIWTASDAPIPWEHFCGCKPGFIQCGSFPFDFCCANCAAINSGVNSAKSSLQSSTARIETLIQQIERYSLR